MDFFCHLRKALQDVILHGIIELAKWKIPRSTFSISKDSNLDDDHLSVFDLKVDIEAFGVGSPTSIPADDTILTGCIYGDTCLNWLTKSSFKKFAGHEPISFDVESDRTTNRLYPTN